MSTDPDPHAPLTRVLRNAVPFSAALLGFVASAATLLALGQDGGFLLLAVLGACLVYVVVLALQSFFVSRRRQLRYERDTALRERDAAIVDREATEKAFEAYRTHAERETRRSVAALERIVDRQDMLYEEKLELTVVIGRDDDEDTIVERRLTSPSPSLTYRSFRPITPPAAVTFADLQMTSHVEPDDGEHLSLVPFVTGSGQIRVIAFFPQVNGSFVWRLRYRPRGLWAPLRRDGIDTMYYDTRSPLGRSVDATFTNLVVRFIFPVGVTGIVHERSGRGVMERSEDETGRRLTTWRADDVEGVNYSWELRMEQRPPR